jgi:hypothetical protein
VPSAASTADRRSGFAHSVSDLARMLAEQIDRLAPELFPAGRRDGNEWRVGSLHGEPGQSLAIHLRGQKAGVWADFSAPDQRGDALDLIAHARCGGNKTEAILWARNWLGLPTGRAAKECAPPPPPAPRPETDDDEATRRKRHLALQLFLAGQPIAGTPADAYLAARGVGIAALGRAPHGLRYHPGLEHPETCRRDALTGRVVWGSGRRYPALLAAVTNHAGTLVACHRTFLAETRQGWRHAKAAGLVRDAKLSLGAIKGGSVRLWRGAAGRPLARITAGDTLAVTEGIEDALTIACAQPAWVAIAAVSLGNMAHLRLPPDALDVVLVFDRDGENSQAARARELAQNRLLDQGRSVRVFQPPEGYKDVNAWWQAAGAGRAA